MPREPKCRRVENVPQVSVFKPAGIPRSCLEEVVLKVEELEAVRLKDLLELEQEECAERMRVSRPTFQRILIEARNKIAHALVQGLALRIEGGDYCLDGDQCRRPRHLQRGAAHCPYLNAPTDHQAEKGGKEMTKNKIAVCAQGDSQDSLVDGRFGRCAYFVLWDPPLPGYEALSNSGGERNQGAGTGSAQELLNKGVGVVIASRIGPKAFTVLQRAGVQVFSVTEGLFVKDALEQYQAGKLLLLEQANNL